MSTGNSWNSWMTRMSSTHQPLLVAQQFPSNRNRNPDVRVANIAAWISSVFFTHPSSSSGICVTVAGVTGKARIVRFCSTTLQGQPVVQQVPVRTAIVRNFNKSEVFTGRQSVAGPKGQLDRRCLREIDRLGNQIIVPDLSHRRVAVTARTRRACGPGKSAGAAGEIVGPGPEGVTDMIARRPFSGRWSPIRHRRKIACSRVHCRPATFGSCHCRSAARAQPDLTSSSSGTISSGILSAGSQNAQPRMKERP